MVVPADLPDLRRCCDFCRRRRRRHHHHHP